MPAWWAPYALDAGGKALGALGEYFMGSKKRKRADAAGMKADQIEAKMLAGDPTQNTATLGTMAIRGAQPGISALAARGASRFGANSGYAVGAANSQLANSVGRGLLPVLQNELQSRRNIMRYLHSAWSQQAMSA
jgi:hypothetical protein